MMPQGDETRVGEKGLSMSGCVSPRAEPLRSLY